MSVALSGGFRGEYCHILALTSIAVLLVSTLVFSPTLPLLAQEELGSLKAIKTAQKVITQGRVLTQLTVTNNGSIPIFEIEFFEYYNQAFTLDKTATLTTPVQVRTFPIEGTGASMGGSQFILQLGPNLVLLPGQSVTLEYWSEAPAPGDFLYPASLVWFSYRFGVSTIRSNMYSNGFIVHVPNQFEALIAAVIPYVVATASGVSIYYGLNGLRKHLSKRRINAPAQDA